MYLMTATRERNGGVEISSLSRVEDHMVRSERNPIIVLSSKNSKLLEQVISIHDITIDPVSWIKIQVHCHRNLAEDFCRLQRIDSPYICIDFPPRTGLSMIDLVQV